MHAMKRLAGMTALCLAAPLGAQQEVTVAAACGPPARIAIERELRMGGVDDPGRIGMTSHFALNSRGQVLFFRSGTGYVFDSDGGFLQSFGARGDGPGEYRTVASLSVGPGDTVHVLDRGNRRLTVLSPELDVISTHPLPVPPAAAVPLQTGGWVVNGSLPAPGHNGRPLHVLSSDGTVESSFGGTSTEDRTAAFSGERVLAKAGASQVWAAFKNQYRIELWDVDDQHVLSLVRDVPWFEPYVRSNRIAPNSPMSPVLLGLNQDAAGILWVLVRTAKPNWNEYLIEFAPGQYAVEEPMHQAMQVVVEALDIRRRCVLSRLETENYILGNLSGDRYLAYFESPDGIPFLDILRLRLVYGSQ